MNASKLRRLAARIPKNLERKENAEDKVLLELKQTHDSLMAAVKDKVDAKTFADLQSQVDALDQKMNTERFGNGLPETKSLGDAFTESAEFKAAAEGGFVALRSRNGSVVVPLPAEPFLSRKAAISTIGLGSGASGVLMPERLPGVTGLPQQELRLRDLMTVRTMTSGNSFDWVKQLARTNNASPQNEGTRKSESTFTYETKTGTIKTLAHFTKITRQALDDVPWLRSTIDGELLYGLLLLEERQILLGDGVGQNLDGIVHQSIPYDTGLNVSGDTALDKLAHAKLQARLAGLGTYAPDGIVLNPVDASAISLIKSDEGASANKGTYVLGDPRGGTQIKTIWGLPVVESDALPSGKFLVGAFSTGATLIDRASAMISIAFQNESDFVENLACLLGESRVGLAVRVPTAFIYGSF